MSLKSPSEKCCGEFTKRVLDKGLSFNVDRSLKKFALYSASEIPENQEIN